MIRRIFTFLFFAIIVLYLTRNWVGRVALEQIVGHRLQTRVRVEGVHIHVMRGDVTIDRIHIYNPDGYSDTDFWHLSQIFARWTYADLFKHSELMFLSYHIDQFVIIKTPIGGSNVAFFHAALSRPSVFPSLAVRDFRFSVGELVVKDYAQNPPQLTHFPVSPQPIVSTQPTDVLGAFRLGLLFAVGQKGMPPLGLDPKELERSIRMWIRPNRSIIPTL